MKKLLTILSGLVMAAAVTYGGDSLPQLTTQFMTEGPDQYADGTPALPGETYLIVYVNDGDEFLGVRADCTLVNSANQIVETSVATAKSACTAVQLQYSTSQYPASGTWLIVLLDTRKNASELGGLVAGNSIAKTSDVLGSDAQAKGITPDSKQVAAQGGVGLVASSASKASNTTPPVIISVNPQGEDVEIKWKNLSVDNYEVHSSTDLASGTWQKAPRKDGNSWPTSAKEKCVAISDASTELSEIVKVSTKEPVRFFKVIKVGN